MKVEKVGIDWLVVVVDALVLNNESNKLLDVSELRKGNVEPTQLGLGIVVDRLVEVEIGEIICVIDMNELPGNDISEPSPMNGITNGKITNRR